MKLFLFMMWNSCRCVWTGFGTAPSLRSIPMGGPVISGNGWGHWLKVDVPKYSSSHCSILALFSGIGWNGSSVGCAGMAVRKECSHSSHVEAVAAAVSHDEDEHPALVTVCSLSDLVGTAPTHGNSRGMMPRSII